MPQSVIRDERLIVALDVPTAAAALELADRLAPHVGFFKVGLQLFLEAGFAVCDALCARGHKVMLDLKFHDIPQTVFLAVSQLAGHDIALATVHGYPQVVEAAAKAKGNTRILAVTVLTSLGSDELQQTGFAGSLADLVRLRAVTSLAAGADGVVCSPLETALLRRNLGMKPVIATPGIRPLDSVRDDQTRTATPKAAVAAGADHIIVGRPITKAPDPAAAARDILLEIG
ncbi:orotidine-5'-phosphate decarboxylase [Solidesulfovibrio sp.]|uniref:orotidine-5'-phosphate decarboxylase n=1 Tax=Solidesulfovibrio sp. TaxID=2910990 RepID=UPI002B203C4A|nr:orotidine-5'-phosphate decarboxylase [Solidesulfovibrio sp.]MEA5090054.1 orotidine-5'-phosphate decarboxylase [Solidesulfovibrio sp.]HML61798.1 orotidine-5'-phosphate decarboxylase [Solidesulfovibrio sp.]